MRTDLRTLLEELYEQIADTRFAEMDAGSYRDIGVLEYVLNRDASKFKSYLIESARLEMSLRQRHPDRFPLSILEYQRVLDALSAGEFEFAEQYSRAMGNTAEQMRAHRFDKALGLTVKAFVEDGDTDGAMEGMAALSTKEKSLVGMLALFRAMAARDEAAAAEAVDVMLDDHKRRLCRGVFNVAVDKHLYVWGVGLLNLARGKFGLQVAGRDPKIPNELLVPVGG